MTWKPIPEEEIWEMLNSSRERMTIPQRRLWETIRIDPERWQQHPYGDQGGGFWVVAILGRRVVWYNDIEEGFNSSVYSQYGEIGAYWCNQDDLEITIQNLLIEIIEGQPSGGYFGPPEEIG
ncbi:MAG: hypothetical protein HGA74_16980 [Deltaproteobacteria bacterium]|nr:hypothetical protein [Deltaproteobacteria bacterium]